MANENKDPVIGGTEEVNAGHLRSFIERIEKLEEEKKAIADDIKDIYAEAKGNGFDVKIMRKIVSIRKQDRTSARRKRRSSASTWPRSGSTELTPLQRIGRIR